MYIICIILQKLVASLGVIILLHVSNDKVKVSLRYSYSSHSFFPNTVNLYKGHSRPEIFVKLCLLIA